jgi:hypothetical protein
MAGWCAKSDRWSAPRHLFRLRLGMRALKMRRDGGRAADRGSYSRRATGSPSPVALFGRAAAVPLVLLGRAVRFLGRKEGTGAWAVPQTAVGSGTGALPVSELRVERRVGVSPSRSCSADTHTAWRSFVRH